MAKNAAEFLVPVDGARVLDIGSGSGKFCLSASHYKPMVCFTGLSRERSWLIVQ